MQATSHEGLPLHGGHAVLAATRTFSKKWCTSRGKTGLLHTVDVEVIRQLSKWDRCTFAPPTAHRTPQRVERSDQIEDTEATRGPRRLKGFVMAAQGHGEHPAAASG